MTIIDVNSWIKMSSCILKMDYGMDYMSRIGFIEIEWEWE